MARRIKCPKHNDQLIHLDEFTDGSGCLKCEIDKLKEECERKDKLLSSFEGKRIRLCLRTSAYASMLRELLYAFGYRRDTELTGSGDTANGTRIVQIGVERTFGDVEIFTVPESFVKILIRIVKRTERASNEVSGRAINLAMERLSTITGSMILEKLKLSEIKSKTEKAVADLLKVKIDGSKELLDTVLDGDEDF